MLSINEPAPTGSVFHTGRGGAGNYRRLAERLPAAPAPLTPIASASSQSSSRVFFSSRGGAGNAHPFSERPVFSFDEELQRDQLIRENAPPVFSVGRGGAGNVVPTERGATSSFYKRNSSETNRRSEESRRSGHSLERIRSGADKLWDRLKM